MKREHSQPAGSSPSHRQMEILQSQWKRSGTLPACPPHIWGCVYFFSNETQRPKEPRLRLQTEAPFCPEGAVHRGSSAGAEERKGQDLELFDPIKLQTCFSKHKQFILFFSKKKGGFFLYMKCMSGNGGCCFSPHSHMELFSLCGRKMFLTCGCCPIKE